MAFAKPTYLLRVRCNRAGLKAVMTKSATERAADVLDVHILDIAAQLEALLRSVREVQRGVLTIRGALPRRDVDPAAEVHARLGLMVAECNALADAVNAARDAAVSLTAPASAEISPAPEVRRPRSRSRETSRTRR